MPAFYFAFDGDTLAVVGDATAAGNLQFDQVGVATIARNTDGSFDSAPIDFALELSVPGGTPTGVIVHLIDATWSGHFEGGMSSSPIELSGNIVVADVVYAAEVLANLDHAAAIGFIAGLFNFDPTMPPETVPFRGDMAVEAAP